MACESMMDMLAEKAGIDPFEFRFRNIARNQAETNSSSYPYRTYPMEAIMLRMRPLYDQAVSGAKAADTPGRRRGVGLAWGGYASSIGNFDVATVALELMPDGIVRFTAVAPSGKAMPAFAAGNVGPNRHAIPGRKGGAAAFRHLANHAAYLVADNLPRRHPRIPMPQYPQVGPADGAGLDARQCLSGPQIRNGALPQIHAARRFPGNNPSRFSHAPLPMPYNFSHDKKL
jgi:hypothetical protein